MFLLPPYWRGWVCKMWQKKKGYDCCLDGMQSCFLPLKHTSGIKPTHVWIFALSKICAKLIHQFVSKEVLSQLQDDISMALEMLSVTSPDRKSENGGYKSVNDYAQAHYDNDKKSYVDDFAKGFSKSSTNSTASLCKEDLTYLLHKLQNLKYFAECISNAYSCKHELTTLHLVYLQCNFSGTSLFWRA